MTPQIALDLSLDSIMVLSRAPDGGWLREGTVRLEDDDMPSRLAELRDVAERRVGEGFVSILILPDSQLLYTSFERDDRRPDETIRALLKGRTPYAVEDLTWDYVERGDRLQVSVVALETLMEAESFAAEYGFQPVVAVGNPQSGPFAAIPNFGPTGLARDLLAGASLDLQLERGFSARPAPPLVEAPAEDVVPEPEGAPESVTPRQDAIADIPTPEATATPFPDAQTGGDERTVEGAAQDEAREDTAAPGPSTPGDLPFAALVEAGREAEAMPSLAASRGAAPADSGARLAKVPPRLSAPRTEKAPRPAVPTIEDAGAARDRPRLKDVVAQVRETGRAAAPTAGERARADLRAAAEVAGTKAQRPDVQTDPPAPTDDLPPLAAPGTWAHRVKLQLAEAEAGGPATADGPAAGKPDSTAPDTRARRAPASRAPAKRSSAKLGLVLTLGLLVALVLVGLGAAMLGREPGEAKASDLLSELLPETQAPARATLVALPTADIEAEASSPSELIAPPSPLTAPLPVILDDEARSSGELAPTLAAAPTLEERPNLETEPAILVTEWMAAGQFVAPDLAQPGANGTVPTDLPANGPSRVVAALTPAAPVLPVVPAAPATVLDPPPATLADSREAALGLTPATAEGVVVDGSYTVLIGRPVAMPAPRPGGAFDRVLAPDDQSAAPQAVTEPEPQVTRSELPDSTGILVIPGRPAVETRPRPSLSEVTPAEPVDPATDILRRVRPVERPETVVALAVATPEEALPAELAVLRRVRPVERPASVAQAEAAARAAIEAAQAAQEAAEQEAAAVDAAAQSAAASLAQAAAAATASVSDLALPRSARPQTRPRTVERIAARMSQERREQQASAPQPQSVARAQQQAAPQIRSAGGNVAAAATERNALRLNQTNLIGVYGRPNDRRALVRLRNGRYVKVEVGDRLDRGRVTAIGDDRLQYQRGNRNVVLQLPRT